MGCRATKMQKRLPSTIRKLRLTRERLPREREIDSAGHPLEKKELDPRLPLTERQLYGITKSWKTVSRNMSVVAVNMFVRYVTDHIIIVVRHC